MLKITMELYDKLLILETKIEKLMLEVNEARNLKNNMQSDYNKLLDKYNALEEENRQLKEDKYKIKEKIEVLISKISD